MIVMDNVTFTAFNRLWKLYKDNLDIQAEDADAWDKLLHETSEIVSGGDGAADPEFIQDFAAVMLESLDRICRKKQ